MISRAEAYRAALAKTAGREFTFSGEMVAGEEERVLLEEAGRLDREEAGRGSEPRSSRSAVVVQPDTFDLHRLNARRHLAFAQGPHTCIGLHLARLEARCAVLEVLTLDDVSLDRARSTAPTGLVFRKPAEVWATWSRWAGWPAR